MPRFDQTGPEGQGPMTGRKMGRCTHFGRKGKNQETAEEAQSAQNQPDVTQGRGLGLGRGRGGRGMGLGRQNRFRGGM